MIVNFRCVKKMKITNTYFDCKYNKKYWQEVRKMTTHLYLGNHVLTWKLLFWLHNIWPGLFWCDIFFSILLSLYFKSKTKESRYIYFFKDELNNVFDTNIFRQVKTGNFISKAHAHLYIILHLWPSTNLLFDDFEWFDCNLCWWDVWTGL